MKVSSTEEESEEFEDSIDAYDAVVMSDEPSTEKGQ